MAQKDNDQRIRKYILRRPSQPNQFDIFCLDSNVVGFHVTWIPRTYLSLNCYSSKNKGHENFVTKLQFLANEPYKLLVSWHIQNKALKTFSLINQFQLTVFPW